MEERLRRPGWAGQLREERFEEVEAVGSPGPRVQAAELPFPHERPEQRGRGARGGLGARVGTRGRVGALKFDEFGK